MSERLLVMHAGTHKTASTYIQNRLWNNRNLLEAKGIHLLTPGNKKTGQHFKMCKYIARGKLKKISKILAAVPPGCKQAIISAEQFTQLLIREELRHALLDVLDAAGFRLRLVIYLRDQPDYINSLYVQEVRRFYHHLDLDEFVNRCLVNRSHWFDYSRMFTPLIDHPAIESQFLPYGSSFGDPYLRLMASQGWENDGEWESADAEKNNDQPGVKGLWLALRVGEQLDTLGMSRTGLKNRSRYIRQYSLPRDWAQDRFYGFNQKRVDDLRTHYQAGNDRFAQRIWGRLWRDVFADLKPQPMNVFKAAEATEQERQELLALVDRVVDDIRSANTACFPGISVSK